MENNELVPTEKTRTYRMGLTVAVVTLLAAAVWIYIRPGVGIDETEVTKISKIDRLYYNLAILGIPNVIPSMDIVLKDTDGNRVKLSDLQGKIVFLNFWTTWCPACRVEMPAMEKLHQRFKGRDFAMVAVSMQESPDRVTSYLKEHDLTFPTLLDEDGRISSRFSVTSIPTTYILNREGAIVGKAVGAREWYGEDAIALFEHLIVTGLDIPPVEPMSYP